MAPGGQPTLSGAASSSGSNRSQPGLSQLVTAAIQLALLLDRPACGDPRDNSPGSLRFRCRDGRRCKFCYRSDKDGDDLVVEELLFWAYPPQGDKPNGAMCYACLRIFNSRFVLVFKTTEN